MSSLPTTREGQSERAAITPTAATATDFLELLAREATPVEFEAPLLAARRSGEPPEVIAELERAKALALQVRSVQDVRRRRESEVTALFETVADLAALKDIDDVLEAIVHRARLLLGSDVSYLSLNDEERGDTYMRVTEGVTSAEFKAVRLPFGAGLGGLVAQTATPYASADYFNDERFEHTRSIDSAVRDEEIVSIVGVPLLLGRKVIGVLYAANHTQRPFVREDVSLLTSLAAHAAVAIDNARLLTETQAALADLRVTSAQLQEYIRGVQRATEAHDRLSAVVQRGGALKQLAAEVGEVLEGSVLLLEAEGELWVDLAGDDAETVSLSEAEQSLVTEALSTSSTVCGPAGSASPISAGISQLGVVLFRRERGVDDVERRIIERAATAAALILLVRRSAADTESRQRGDLLADLLQDADRDLASLRDRARRLDVDLDSPHTVAVVELDGDRSRALRATEHLASLEHGLATVIGHRLAVVLPGTDPGRAARRVHEHLARVLGEPPTVGAAGPATGPGEIVTAHEESQRCANALIALDRRGQAACSAELGFVGLLIGGDRDVGGFIESRIGPVLAYDAERGTVLRQTLTEYFAQGQHLGRTAARLTVHPNTVTQRLDRVGQLLGSDWTTPAAQLEIQLALRLSRLARPSD